MPYPSSLTFQPVRPKVRSLIGGSFAVSAPFNKAGASTPRDPVDGAVSPAQYMAAPHMGLMIQREIKKGSAELLILALVEHHAKHGYELCKLIESRSKGVLRFHVASLYPLLYRLEERQLIEGRWVEKAGQRRRRYYRITPEGRRVLVVHRRTWKEFIAAVNRIAGVQHA
jgi:transcriptional regulator